MELPSVPILFMKPSTSLAGPFPFDSVVVPKVAQDESSDYESELCVIIGQDCKDVSEADSINYILGYTASVSSLSLFFSPSLRLP